MRKSKTIIVFSIVNLLWLSTNAALADEGFQYFDHQELDFWGEKKESPPVFPVKQETGHAPLPKETLSSFPWKKYTDPKNDEFFKEGDYTPPAPFMEIARNPTDENIENWFRYLDMKNQLTHRLQEKLESYASAHGMAVASEESSVPPASVQTTGVTDLDPKRFRLRLYFDSKCPHCEHMMGTLAELSALGFFVELKQVDQDVSVRARIPFPVKSAMPPELRQYGIQSVPLLLVGDLKRHSFFKIEGYQPTNAVLQTIRGQTTQKGDPS
jgi:hypothetical protein